jgi:hypothetical protein
VKSRGRGVPVPVGSIQKVRILEGRMRGLPFLLEAFRRRFSWVSRDAVVVKKCPGSLETLIVMSDRQETSRTPFYVSERAHGQGYLTPSRNKV